MAHRSHHSNVNFHELFVSFSFVPIACVQKLLNKNIHIKKKKKKKKEKTIEKRLKHVQSIQ